MATWTATTGNNGGEVNNLGNGSFEFIPQDRTQDAYYTISCTGDNGCVASMAYMVQGCTPPTPPTPSDCDKYTVSLSGPSTVIIPANGTSSGVLISVSYNDRIDADNVTGLTANDFTFELTDGLAGMSVEWELFKMAPSQPNYYLRYKTENQCSYNGYAGGIKVSLKNPNCPDVYDIISARVSDSVMVNWTYTIEEGTLPSGSSSRYIGFGYNVDTCSGIISSTSNATLNQQGQVSIPSNAIINSASDIRITNLSIPGGCQNPSTCMTVLEASYPSIKLKYNG
jgi:hypothetical protein